MAQIPGNLIKFASSSERELCSVSGAARAAEIQVALPIPEMHLSGSTYVWSALIDASMMSHDVLNAPHADRILIAINATSIPQWMMRLEPKRDPVVFVYDRATFAQVTRRALPSKMKVVPFIERVDLIAPTNHVSLLQSMLIARKEPLGSKELVCHLPGLHRPLTIQGAAITAEDKACELGVNFIARSEVPYGSVQLFGEKQGTTIAQFERSYYSNVFGVEQINVNPPATHHFAGTRGERLNMFCYGALRDGERQSRSGAIVILPGSGVVAADGWGFAGQTDYLAWAQELSMYSSVFLFDRVDFHVADWPSRASELEFEDLVAQARNALVIVKNEYENAPIYLVGHSLGGLIALSLANGDVGIDGVLCCGTPASSLRSILRRQAEQLDAVTPSRSGKSWSEKHEEYIALFDVEQAQWTNITGIERLSLAQRKKMLSSIIELTGAELVKSVQTKILSIVSGSKDDVVQPSEALLLQGACLDVAVPCHVEILQGRGHDLELTGNDRTENAATAAQVIAAAFARAFI